MRRLGILLTLALSTGCGGTLPIVIDGSSTVFPISDAAREAFKSVHPDVRIKVDNHGTGGGFGRYLAGEIDIVDASRPAKPEEAEKAKAQGLDWTAFTIGHDGLTVAVHSSNDFVDSLTVEQLRRLYAPESAVHTWKDLNPAWPDRKIILFSPDNDSGTYDYFVEAILPKEKAQRQDVQASADDNTLVTGVSGDADAIGYFGFAYYQASKERVRAVPIRANGGAEPVLPTRESVVGGTYKPLSRPLFIYVKNSSLVRPDVSSFLRYYLEHATELSERAGYVGPTEADRAANSRSLQTALGGLSEGAS